MRHSLTALGSGRAEENCRLKARDSDLRPQRTRKAYYAQRQEHGEKRMKQRNGLKRASRKATLLRAFICLALLISLCWSLRHGAAQSGVLIPSSGSKPDPATLSL